MIKIEKIVPGGQALGTMEDGKKAFFWNALPGEMVADYQITKKKSHYIEAIATNIDSSSSYRQKPKDECFLSTSPWQIIDYEYELKLKQEIIKEVFRENHIDISLPEIITDYHDYYYRNKMEYALYWDNEQSLIKLALHQRGSHRKIPIIRSSIEHQVIFKEATKIINKLNSKKEPAYKYQSLLLRCNKDGELSGGLYENHKPHPSFNNLTDTILGFPYSYSPNGFFQINPPVYELALKEIKKHIDTETVLDLYSGVGSIGLSVARDHHLTLVESDKFAFQEMTNNVKNLINKHITPILSKSEEALDFISDNQTVIIDPPRSGCDKNLINRFLESTPTKIIYLSCNPITQARDIKPLLDKYIIKEIKAFNFFPHTPHIENLVILEKTEI